MTRSYDLVVIGAGPAGESAAELASFFGHSVVIVEKNKPGGVVTTTGGAPTKTLRGHHHLYRNLRPGYYHLKLLLVQI
jgi:NAD(P) transhydrogenase